MLAFVRFSSGGAAVCGRALPGAAGAPDSGDQRLPQGAGRHDQHPSEDQVLRRSGTPSAVGGLEDRPP